MSLVVAITCMAIIISLLAGGFGALVMYWMIKIRPVPATKHAVKRAKRTAPKVSHEPIKIPPETPVKTPQPPAPAMRVPRHDVTEVRPNPHGIQPSPTLRWRPPGPSQ